MKNSQASSFISFACWNTTIGIDIKIVDAKSGKLIKVSFLSFCHSLFLNISEIIRVIKITETNHQILFIKKAKVGLLNI